jgi:hypothetical protein
LKVNEALVILILHLIHFIRCNRQTSGIKMVPLNPLKLLFQNKPSESTTWIQRGADRRLTNLGRKIDRRKAPDRRQSQSGTKKYEYIGLSQGGWTEVE